MHMTKVVLVSSLLPETNYSYFLSRDLSKEVSSLVVYTDKNPENKKLSGCGDVKLVWDKNLLYIPQIISQLIKDKPDVIHIQHEINMYGGVDTAVAFPLLLLLCKLTGTKVVTTVHAVVDPAWVTTSFVNLFRGQDSKIPPFALKLFFNYLYKSIGLFSDKLIVHTNLLKKILVDTYGISAGKILVIPHGVQKLQLEDTRHDNYFCYLGYLVKRKGLENLLIGFGKFLDTNPQSGFKLVLAGGPISGQEFALDELKGLVEKANLQDKVVFTGFLSEKEIAQYFKHAYAVAIPSVISIAASGPFALAMSYGKCVLASKIGNFEEEIRDNVDGILVPDDKWDSAFTFVYKNLAKVKSIESKVVEKARARQWDRIAKLHVGVYEQLSAR